jgi:biotin synthase-like enzyme
MNTWETPPFRPPTEAYSLLIRATRNCPWRRCGFCGMYGGAKLEIRPVEEVKRDILAARALADQFIDFTRDVDDPDQMAMIAQANGLLWLQQGRVTQAFIGDSNSPIMKTSELAEIVSFLYETFPSLERVTSYARAKTLFNKKPEELKTLREAGLTRLHVGLESGDDVVLKEMNKGATAEEMVRAGRKAIEAGFELSEYLMPGLGGRERWEEHALGSAEALSRINPHFIRLRTLRLGMETDIPLAEKCRAGEFTLQSLEGLVDEVGLLIENLDVTSELVSSDFASNYYLIDVEGHLPQDKEKMLKNLDTSREWIRDKRTR